jgi:WD40 repeat protein
MPPVQLFLSYNSADRTSVVAVQKLLEARGITTFLDRGKLVPGLAWPQALEEALRGVRGVAVFIGRELGGWQKREMWFAMDRQVREEKQGRAFPVVPVLLPGADLTPGFLFSNTWIDLRAGFEGVGAADALDAFERAINSTRPAQSPERAALICPYRGLQAFREEDAAFFFGRKAFADQLLEFTLGKDLVAVVGPSGSGKSSVVQAGLLPLLRRQRPPANTWDAVSFTPGKDPFHRLASALIALLEPDKDEVARLAEAEQLGANFVGGKTSIEAVVSRVIEKSNGTGRLLLVADQFEELFTLTPEPSRRHFAQALLRALGNAPFTLMIALRADFYSQIITVDRGLTDRLAPAQVNIGALTRDELRESITAPARLVGLEFEPGLVERILTDVGSEPGRLPLLEFALTELWQRRAGSQLTNRAYNEIGGATGALAQRAEAEFARLTPEEQTAARRLFSRLVRVARPEEAGEDTRQHADLSDADTIAKRVAESLADARLLVTSGETNVAAAEQPAEDVPERKGTFSVEVAHEALIRNWERLRVWLNEDREFLLWRQRLQVQVAEWRGQKQDAGYLLRGTPLSEAERWLLGRPQDLTDAEQQLIRESIALRERERKEEEERRQAEVENAKQMKEAAEARAEAERRRAMVLRRSALALASLLLLALGSVGFALWHRAVARARELVSASVLSEETDPEIAVLIAAQAMAATSPWGRKVLPEAEEQLHHAVLLSHVRATFSHTDAVTSVVWSPDGKRLATGSDDNTAKVWDAQTGKELLTLRGRSDAVMSVAWSPDGKRLATASDDKMVKVWDAETGKELLTLSGHNDSVCSVVWSPDGKRLATGSYDTTAKVWDAESGRELLTLSRHSGCVRGVAWSPDGKRLATGSWDHTAKVWDAGTGKELRTLIGHSDHVTSVAWSPDGKRLVTGSGDSTAKVWDAEAGKVLLTLVGHTDHIEAVAWSPDGERLATASVDRAAIVWDAGSGRASLTLRGHSTTIMAVAWSPDGKRLATGSADHTAKVWDPGSDRELLALKDGSPIMMSVAWSPDGRRLATGSADFEDNNPENPRASFGNGTKEWDAVSGELLRAFDHDDDVWSVAWSRDGKRLATGGWGDMAKVWDAQTGHRLGCLQASNGSRPWVTSVAWSPDGRRLATGSLGMVAKLWDAESGEEVLELDRRSGLPRDVTWSPDGTRLATEGPAKSAKVWDAGTGKPFLTLGPLSCNVMCLAQLPHFFR